MIRRLGLLLIFAALAAVRPAYIEAQIGAVLTGSVVGAVAGSYVSLGLVATRARGGRFLYAPGDIGLQLLPVPVLAVAGGLLGHDDGDRLRDAVSGSALGFGVGGAAGALLGVAIWKDTDGAWAGAVMGSSLGLLLGGAIAASRWAPEPSAVQDVASFSLRLPR